MIGVLKTKNNPPKIKNPVRSNSHLKKHALKPKSDISIITNSTLNKELAVTRSHAITNDRPLYDPSEKTDPFQPLFKEKPEKKTGKLVPVDTGGKNKTILEGIDLSQLKLTGIILSQNGNKGLVEETSGRGHILAIGTKIGKNGGKVSIIFKDKVIIEEKMKNFYGKIFIEKKELKLFKNSTKI